MGDKPKFQTVQEGRHKAKRVLRAASRYLYRLPEQTDRTRAASRHLEEAFRNLQGRVGMSKDEQITALTHTRVLVANALTEVQQGRKALNGSGDEATMEALDNICRAIMEAKKRVTGALNTARLRNFEKHQEAKRRGETPKFTYSDEDPTDEFLVHLLSLIDSLPQAETEESYHGSYGGDEDDEDDSDEVYTETSLGAEDGGKAEGFTESYTVNIGGGRQSLTEVLENPVVAGLIGAVTNLINAEADKRKRG